MDNKKANNNLVRKLTDEEVDKIFAELQASRKEAEIKRPVEPTVRLRPEEIKYNKEDTK